MRTIAHISDLHFGREDASVVAGLVRDLRELAPSLVVVSGDLTQRARHHEFLAARAFLSSLGSPVLTIPGNHDVPLFNVAARLLRPFDGYRREIASETEPYFCDEEVAVVGVNVVKPSKWKDGLLGARQADTMTERFSSAPSGALRILVTHQPFLSLPHKGEPHIDAKALETLSAVQSANVDLLLAGHLHEGFTMDVRTHCPPLCRSMVIALAGTATSLRRRRETNTYNLITLGPSSLLIEQRAWAQERFEAALHTRYAKSGLDWLRQ